MGPHGVAHDVLYRLLWHSVRDYQSSVAFKSSHDMSIGSSRFFAQEMSAGR